MAIIPRVEERELPLVIRASGEDAGARDVGALCQWLKQEASQVQAWLMKHGAILFRGFAVEGPEDFERIARAVDPELKNEYLGTSPRDALTDYVFSASELPDYYPIPQHCEMSFCAEPPRRVFFCCLEAPAEGSGETPLCDFRNVWRDLDPAVKQRFEAGGLRIVRNYGPPGQNGNDAMQLKGWDAMFLTRDRAAVEEKCREQHFEPTWLEGDGLRLVHSQPVSRGHPVTGETVWHNHLTTFHRSTGVDEYERIVALRPTDRHRGLLKLARDLEEKAAAKGPEEQSMHVTYLDGSEIPREDVAHVRDVVWRHLVPTPWEQGDVIAIDNHSTSHGRLPYEGPRQVAVCWA